jgi:hypothetical protein
VRATWTLPVAAVALAALALTGVHASSHREAPLISSDPLADNTDVMRPLSNRRPSRQVAKQ